MGLSSYNGFPGPMREAVGRRQAKAWKNGDQPAPTTCEVCGQTEGAIHGHAEDYSRDDVYLPICITCHLILHMRFREPLMWDKYRAWVRAGWQGPPLEQRNGLQQIKRLYGGRVIGWAGTKVWDARTATVLDMIPPIKFHHPNAPDAPCITANEPRGVGYPAGARPPGGVPPVSPVLRRNPFTDRRRGKLELP